MAIVAFSSLVIVVHAVAEPALIPRDAFFAPQDQFRYLSPDGSRIAIGESRFGIPTVDRIEDVNDTSKVEDVGFETRGRIRHLTWSADGTYLLAEIVGRDGVQVVALNVATGDERNIAADFDRVVGFAGVSPRHPLEVLIRVQTNEDAHELWRCHLETGDKSKLIDLNPKEHIYTDFDFRPRVLAQPVGICELALLRRDGDEWVPLRTLECDWTNIDGKQGQGVRRVLGVDGTGETLYIVDPAGRDKAVLLAVSLDAGQEKVLAEDPDADLSVNVLMNPHTAEPALAFAQFGTRRYYVLDGQYENNLKNLSDRLGHQVEIQQQSLNGDTWIATVLDGGPDQQVLYRCSDGFLRELGTAYSSMDDYQLATRTGHVASTRAGVYLPVHVYLPPGTNADGDGRPDEPLPTLLYVHGGPSDIVTWDDWNGHSVRAQQLLANRGYAAIRIEFRGTGGLGHAVRRAGQRQWGGAVLDDVEDIATWAVEQGIAAKGRIGIWGFSHGGYTTLAALAFKPDQFACGFDWSGPSNLLETVGKWSETPFADILREDYGDERTAEGEASLRAQSPLFHAENISRPLLMAYGGRDEAVPYETHAAPLVEMLRTEGRQATCLLFENEDHGFGSAQSWEAVWAVAEHFFAEHLGGRYEPMPDKLPRGVAAVLGAELVPGLEGALQ